MATFPAPKPHHSTPVEVESQIQLAEDLAEIAERAESFTSATGVMIAVIKGSQLLVRTSLGTAPEVGDCIPFPSGITGLSATTRKPQSSAMSDVESQMEAAFRTLNIK